MPAKSESQRRLFGAALEAKRTGKKPSYVPDSMMKMPEDTMREFAMKTLRKKKK